jgi:addiction module HigA family antidote
MMMAKFVICVSNNGYELDLTIHKVYHLIPDAKADNRIYQILHGRRSITADTALRLGKFFNTGPEFWLNLLQAYELDVARQEIGGSLEQITPYQATSNP